MGVVETKSKLPKISAFNYAYISSLSDYFSVDIVLTDYIQNTTMYTYGTKVTIAGEEGFLLRNHFTIFRQKDEKTLISGTYAPEFRINGDIIITSDNTYMYPFATISYSYGTTQRIQVINKIRYYYNRKIDDPDVLNVNGTYYIPIDKLCITIYAGVYCFLVDNFDIKTLELRIPEVTDWILLYVNNPYISQYILALNELKYPFLNTNENE